MELIHLEKEFYYSPNVFTSNIAECFGLESGYKKKICSIDIPPIFSILYITGDSGSGKSTILNLLAPNYLQENIPYDLPLSSWCGEGEENEQKAINLLSLCGLSDATMFISKYEYLSDSEKARARMFLELISDKDTIVIDEFLSTLDRKTAKSLAYCFQKAIRALNKKLIVATAHNDLTDYLKPDYIIEGKSYPSDFKLIKNKYDDSNPFIEKITFKYVNKEDYRNCRLGELHYKGKYTGGVKEILFAYYENEVIACLVSTYNMSTKGRRISRVVVHPSYRSIGVGKLLVKKYISDFTDTDVVASMALYNKVFDKAGMIRVKDSIVKSPSGLRKEIADHGFNISMWHSRNYCLEFAQSQTNRNILSKYASKCTHLVKPGGLKLTEEEIAEYIRNDAETAGRVLYQLRDRTMAKYITKEMADASKRN